MICKKYILSALLLFSNHAVFSSSIPQSLYSYSCESPGPRIALIGIGTYLGIMLFETIRTQMHNLLAEKVFFARYKYNTYDKQFDDIDLQQNRFNPQTTLSFLEKYKSLLQYIFKFLLYFDYKKTQKMFNKYIEKIYIPKSIYSSETRTWIKQSDRKNRQQIIEILVQFGIDLRFVRKYHDWYRRDKSMVTEACTNRDARMLRYLLETVKLNPDNWDQLTLYDDNPNHWPSIETVSNPLMRASHAGDIKVVTLLTQHKTNTHPFYDGYCYGYGYNSPIIVVINQYNMSINSRHTDGDETSRQNRADKFLRIFQYLTEYTLQKNNFHIKNFNELALLLSNTPSDMLTETIESSANDIVDRCFQCDESIWLPHPRTNGEYPKRISEFSEYGNYETKHKEQVKSFLLDNLSRCIKPFPHITQALQSGAANYKTMQRQREEDTKKREKEKKIIEIAKQIEHKKHQLAELMSLI